MGLDLTLVVVTEELPTQWLGVTHVLIRSSSSFFETLKPLSETVPEGIKIRVYEPNTFIIAHDVESYQSEDRYGDPLRFMTVAAMRKATQGTLLRAQEMSPTGRFLYHVLNLSQYPENAKVVLYYC